MILRAVLRASLSSSLDTSIDILLLIGCRREAPPSKSARDTRFPCPPKFPLSWAVPRNDGFLAYDDFNCNRRSPFTGDVDLAIFRLRLGKVDQALPAGLPEIPLASCANFALEEFPRNSGLSHGKSKLATILTDLVLGSRRVRFVAAASVMMLDLPRRLLRVHELLATPPHIRDYLNLLNAKRKQRQPKETDRLRRNSGGRSPKFFLLGRAALPF